MRIDYFILATIVAVLYGALIFAVGPYAWDDGAITLSFARTLAESGRFSLTPLSDVTEGTSSLLYVFLFAGMWKVLNPDFYSAILMGQVVSLGFLITNTLLIYEFSCRALSSRLSAIAIAGFYVLIPMNFREVINGMEMLAFGTLLLLYAKAYSHQGRLALALIPLLLLCRFEAVLYLGFANLMIYLLARDAETRVFSRNNLALLVSLFLLLTIVRLGVFDTYLPNTIWAKLNPPYSLDGLSALRNKLYGGAEYITVFGPILASIGVLLALSRKKYNFSTIELWLTVAFLIFAFAAGKNWGYDGRMVLGMMPLLILWNTELAAVLTREPDGSPRLQRGFPAVVFPLALTLVANLSLLEGTLHIARNGYKWANEKESNGEEYETGWYGVTPENYKLTGEAITELSRALGLENTRFAVPDVGGLGLCCDNLRVLDIALLTSPFLAHEGYEGLEQYLEREQPDFIQTHGIWSKVSGIYDKKFFSENYSPLIFRNTLIWARKDHYEKLLSSNKWNFRIINSDEIRQARYAQFDYDQPFLAEHRILNALPFAE